MNKQQRGSMGCPVARHSILFDREVATADQHVQRLIEIGHLKEVSERSNAEKVRLTQEFSAIDRVLEFFAWQLDTYADRYGTPILDDQIVSGLTHKDIPRHNYLVRRDGDKL